MLKVSRSVQTRSRYWDKHRLKMDLLVVCITDSGKLRMSKPCPNCVRTLSQNRSIQIRHVYYSDRDGGITRVKFSELCKELVY